MRNAAEHVCEWSETRTIACLKLRAGQKIVNARLELKGLSDGRASRSATGNRARFRLIIEVGREVAFNAEMLTEVTDNRCLKSRFRGVVCSRRMKRVVFVLSLKRRFKPSSEP